MPSILIGITVAIFITFTRPLYTDITDLRSSMAAYDEALNNSKSLEIARDKLTQKYNSIGNENLSRLEKLLPPSVDNIRLILEIEKLATAYSMSIKDVKYSAEPTEKDKANTNVVQGGIAQNVQKDYGVWTLQFSTEGSYSNFISFVKDIENHLRIVDIASVNFSVDNTTSTLANSSNSSTNVGNLDSYKYDFTIKTYWLKN